MKYLGDIVIVKHIKKNIPSTLIHIPETVESKSGGILAEVLGLGDKAKAALPINIGDTVIVPQQLGSRNRIPNNPDAIVYDSEDVVAKVSD